MRSSTRAGSTAWLVVALLALTIGACASANANAVSTPAPVASASAKAAASASASAAAPLARPSPRLIDPLWIQARDADPAERIRLATAVGASGLLEGVEDGGEVEATALAALPYADDAESALGRLGELARAGKGGARRPLLEAILAIAGRPRRQREALDPEGVKRCAEALLVLAAEASAPRAERSLAVSAARALAENGYLDPARIPGDLDPK